LYMHAEKPFIEISVGRANPSELPIVLRIYAEQEGKLNNVGCHNTWVGRNSAGLVIAAVTTEEIKPGWISLRIGGVDPVFERHGVGSQLMTGVFEELRKMGYRSVTVDLPTYKPSQEEFYKKMGFKRLDPESVVLHL